MSAISGLTSSVIYPALSSGGLINYVNGATDQTQQIDNLANSARILTSISRSYFKEQQNTYRQQVRNFNTATHNLYNNATNLSRTTANQATSKTLTQVSSTLDAYNKVVSAAKQNVDLSVQGKTVVNDFNKIMQDKKDELATVGITQNADTGQWTVDKQQFTKALSGDQKSRDNAISIVRELGTNLGQDAASAMKKPATDYFKSPGADLAATYTQLLNRTNSSLNSKGIFLDLLA